MHATLHSSISASSLLNPEAGADLARETAASVLAHAAEAVGAVEGAVGSAARLREMPTQAEL